MRFIVSSLVAIWMMLYASVALAQPWYEGGTLHDATLSEWKQASSENKLATIGDMVSAAYSRERFVPLIQNTIKSGRMPAIKKIAQALVDQMNQVANNPEIAAPSKKVAEVVVMLMIANDILID